LAGLVLNRTHPVLADLPAAQAETVAQTLERAGEGANSAGPLAAAVLRLHADRVTLARRERRLLARFRRAHPAVAMVAVPALAFDVHDLPALRGMGRLLGREQPAVIDSAPHR
ncbi:MAG: hypothetical protein WBF76_13130, partial [Pseudonocardiaceae bacterium]